MEPFINSDQRAVPLHPTRAGAMYASADVDEARKVVSGIFCPHVLRPKAVTGIRDFRMNHVKFGKASSLNYLQYGSEVIVEPGEMQHVFNVQVQLTGATFTECGKTAEAITTGQAGVLSPTRYVTMDWTADSSMLIYSVGRSALDRMLQTIIGSSLTDPVIFDPVLDVTSKKAASFWRALRFLQIELEASEQMLSSPLAAEHFEQSLILSLLYSQHHNYSGALKNGLSPAAPVHVKRVENYIREHADSAISIEEMAEVSGVSARTLFEGFRRFRSTSPMKYLRDVRLDNVHRDLQTASPGTTVTEIAMKWGFYQLGRFSVEYKRRFGESPSTTLRSGENNTCT